MASTETSQTTKSQPKITPESQRQLIRNISIAAVILCPAIIALPPRKLDFYTVALVGGTFFASNNLAQEYTGRSIITRAQDRMKNASGSDLPPKALEIQKRLREERIQLEAQRRSVKEEEREGVLDELRRREERVERKRERGLVQRIWLGNEDEDWKAKRDQREKEALESGEGYSGLIVDQIREVFGATKKKLEDVKEIDEKVVEAEKEGRK